MNIAVRRFHLALLLMLSASAALAQSRPLAGHVPTEVLAQAQRLGRVAPPTPVALALTLPLRNSDDLQDFLRRVHDPTNTQYGRFFTPEEFTERFGPTRSDYEAVRTWAQAQGLRVTGTHANRLVLDVAGSAGTVQAALGVRLGRYQTMLGREFRAAENAPRLPVKIAARLAGIAGLNTVAVRRPRAREAFALPAGIGSGPRGGLTPLDIRNAYNLNSAGLTGAGQTLAVFELANYQGSDVDSYARMFSLPVVPRQNIAVDGGADLPADGSDEATLDIELQMALAPGASKILVYQGPNTDAGVLDTYNRIAIDNIAKQISTSWGSAEATVDTPTRNAEYAIFQQMAAQGQTIYAAAGDEGAFDDGTNLGVDDPGSQPFVCGVGGTRLATTGVGGTYVGETTWNAGSAQAGAGGGGISQVWPLPDYQQGIISPASGGSGKMRNVPDVALNADPNTGYAIFYSGTWHVYGGASCAAPLWAGFTALVNQQRVANGSGVLGAANPSLYRAATANGYGVYASLFHDIADNSNNLRYVAVGGYDLATGLGSFNGANLLAALSSGPAPGGGIVGGSFRAGLNFFSMPYDYPNASLDGLFGYSGVRLAAWRPDLLQYVLNPTPNADRAHIGQGYWARFPRAVTVTAKGNAADAHADFGIGLGVGWNSIGDPFPAVVPVAGLKLDVGGQIFAFADAVQAGLIDGTLYRYDASLKSGQGDYVAVGAGDVIAPGQGLWLHASRPLNLIVPPP